MDWDGTCTEKVEWPNHPPLTLDAAQALHLLLEQGYEVVIHSTRTAPREVDEVTRVKDPFAEHQYIQQELLRMGLYRVKIWDKSWKPGALAYIDDKGLHHNGDWSATLEEVQRRL